MDAIKERSNAIVQNETIDKSIALDVVSMIHETETLLIRELAQKDDKIKKLEHEIEILKNENKIKHIEEELLYLPKMSQTIDDIQKITETIQRIDLNTFIHRIDNEISQICNHIQDLQQKFGTLDDKIENLDKEKDKKKKRNTITYLTHSQ